MSKAKESQKRKTEREHEKPSTACANNSTYSLEEIEMPLVIDRDLHAPYRVEGKTSDPPKPSEEKTTEEGRVYHTDDLEEVPPVRVKPRAPYRTDTD